MKVKQQQSVAFKVCGYYLFFCLLDSAGVPVFNGDTEEGSGWEANSPSVLVAYNQTKQQTSEGQQVTVYYLEKV